MQIKVAVVLAAVALAVAGGAAVGQDDPIAAREALMKNNGAALRTLNAMVKGEAAFDGAAAKAAFETISTDMAAFKQLFPEGSQGGKASPAIWSDRAGFDAAVDKLISDADAAAASTATPEEVQAGFGAVAANCGSCHQKYRT